MQKKRITEENWMYLIFFLSIFIRLIFCAHHSYTFSYHDLGALSDPALGEYSDGHIGYLQYIYHNNSLPDFDPRSMWCFYNPPLFYILSAIWLKGCHLFGLSMYQSIENLQFLTFLFATAAIYISYQILKEFQIKGKALQFSFMIIAFHPYFIIGGATLNNDILSILCMLVAFLYTIRWYKESTYKNICMIAIAVGLGMMTKTSVGLIAPPIAMIFLVKFIREKEYLRYIKQFIVFGILCVPLGLYWPIRNDILFGMPLIYVQELLINSGQYLDMSLWKRINPLDFSNYGYPFVKFNVDTDYHIWTEMFKSSVFDELKINGSAMGELWKENCCRALVFVNMILGAGALLVGIYNNLKRAVRNVWLNRFKYVFYLMLMGSYLKFCIMYPQVCSMNFRYIVPTLVIGAINLGVYMNSEYSKKIIVRIMECSMAIFSLLSAVVYVCVL